MVLYHKYDYFFSIEYIVVVLLVRYRSTQLCRDVITSLDLGLFMCSLLYCLLIMNPQTNFYITSSLYYLNTML